MGAIVAGLEPVQLVRQDGFALVPAEHRVAVERQARHSLRPAPCELGGLSSLCVFDRSQASTAEAASLEERACGLLYFYPRDVPLEAQVAHANFCEALIDFGATFSPPGPGGEVDGVYLSKRRYVFYRGEGDVWVVAVLVNPQVPVVEAGAGPGGVPGSGGASNGGGGNDGYPRSTDVGDVLQDTAVTGAPRVPGARPSKRSEASVLMSRRISAAVMLACARATSAARRGGAVR